MGADSSEPTSSRAPDRVMVASVGRPRSRSSVTVPVPEWGGQEVRIMLEQDAAYTENGVVYMDGRQTAFHLV